MVAAVAKLVKKDSINHDNISIFLWYKRPFARMEVAVVAPVVGAPLVRTPRPGFDVFECSTVTYRRIGEQALAVCTTSRLLHAHEREHKHIFLSPVL
ncbi:unnamed protein product [Macrosiphum euphorbiae]|uniref:Uncharacterized protein n=1 Tax=Macrosiphum euphorbiae TaxID=13131 RepID=A0AAV0WIT3_9HEMI|nr:unnamed protein product [Macrosiphum euphorbiae]